MTSTIPAFKTALRTLLAAAITTAEVHYGSGDPDTMGSRAVLIGPAKRTAPEFVCGMSQANEGYDVEVITSVIGSALDSYEALNLTAHGINDQVVTAVLGWSSLPAGVNNVYPTDSEDDEAVGEGFREAVVKQTVHVDARI